MKKLANLILIMLLILLDQLVKFWTQSYIPLGGTRTFLPPFFSLTYLQNRGAAFSILQDQQWFFAIITLVFMIGAFCYWWVSFGKHKGITLGLSLFISGGLGNFIDRVRLGYVVDMIDLDFMNFAIFNVADSYLTVGVLILFVALWKEDN